MAKTRDYKKEYEKRVARALAQGKTRQQARGHKASEHVFRKPKAASAAKPASKRKPRLVDPDAITVARERYITKWAYSRDFEIADWEVEPEALVQHAKTFGWDWFLTYSNTWQEMRDTYKTEVREGVYISRGIGYLQHMASSVGADEMSWLYYH